ncbi:dihydrouridine synthase 1 [Rhodnius prolixus]|uniref:dihydrouridine synthase 1 n=1 Tax=Rhodnius prolixus TaxID=13249 RepID=UPI003D18A590
MSEGSDIEEDNVWIRLGRPQLVVAPMVDASELAWRLLSRAHKAQLCYSPMYHSAIFIKDARYRREALLSSPQDRPLIIQFCGNDPNTILAAAKLAEPHCDAIDINLGCPQAIAKRGNYGAFLQDDWELLTKIIKTLRSELSIPVTCKVRVFECIEKSVEYAKMLERAGCQMLTVHGRTREQKGPLTGIASWKHIKAVRKNVKIPLFANGNIQCMYDIERCLEETGVNGVMTAEGNLYNPYIFEGIYPPAWQPALEYLDLVEQYPCPTSYSRGHLFKIFHQLFALEENVELREEIAKGAGLEDFRNAVIKLKEKYLPLHEGLVPWNSATNSYDLKLPPWLCQPYVRISPEDHMKKMEIKRDEESAKAEKENCKGSIPCKREAEEGQEAVGLSKKKLKKLLRCNNRGTSLNPHCRKEVAICKQCPNPRGLKCTSSLCKTCCRNKCYLEEADCPGHGILIKTRREKARKLSDKKVLEQDKPTR